MLIPALKLASTAASGLSSAIVAANRASDEMIDEMKTVDNVNTVIIHSIEKTLFDLTEICEVKDNLKRCDITLESVIDGVESGTIEGWFIFSMLSTVAEYKRNIIKQIKEFDKTN